MRKVERSTTVPEALDRVYRSDGKTELERAMAVMAENFANPTQKPKKYEFDRYRDAQVKDLLDEMFYGKCAYCEAYFAGTQPVDVEHYRPKGGVDGVDDHDGYWWLAMAWDNLLPSCIDCNRKRRQKVPNMAANVPPLPELADAAEYDRTLPIESVGKATSFPLADEATRVRATAATPDHIAALAIDAEARLLLDPTRDTPSDHLTFHVDPEAPVGLALPVANLPDGAEEPVASAMGRASIQVYGLNRLGLVQARTRVLRDVEFMVRLLEQVFNVREQLATRAQEKRALANTPERAADIDLMEKLVQQFSVIETTIKARIEELSGPAAPFSECVKAWIKARIQT